MVPTSFCIGPATPAQPEFKGVVLVWIDRVGQGDENKKGSYDAVSHRPSGQGGDENTGEPDEGSPFL